MPRSAEVFANVTLSPREQAILELIDHQGALRARDLAAAGLHHEYLRMLERKGIVRRVGRGLYSRTEGRTSGQDMIEASRAVPNGVICLLSALVIYELTLQAPWEVWVAVHRKAWQPRVSAPPVRVVAYPDEAFAAGVVEARVDGILLRTYSAPKTVVDCFRFQRQVGLDVALEALGNYRSSTSASVDEIWKFAKIDRVERKIRPYIEAVWR